MPQPPFWAERAHRDRRPLLEARGRIQRAVRDFFGDRGFVEVETPILQVSPGNEVHLHAFATELVAPDGSVRRRFLRTSPEFACKKLLAAGEARIFEFARVFRNREEGALHYPEFTLLEWYRAHQRYDLLMDDCGQLLRAAADAAGSRRFMFRERGARAHAEPERITVAKAFQTFADIDLLGTVCGDSGNRDALAAAAQASGIRVAADDTWGDIFSRILLERIEPNLEVDRPTILYEYPAPQAALARRSAADPRVAERFELYVCGIELANAFGELIDAAEQRRRFERDMTEKTRVYGERYPLDEDFLSALQEMPDACGIALGFDRLVMLLTGASRIEQVLWAPVA
jgi:elongation factor P--(R)-beta-lysine ligase